MFDKFRRFILNNQVARSSDKPLIELNTRLGSDTFYDADDFRNNYVNYMVTKFNNDKLTDPDNQCQVVRAVNALYLDGDFHFTSEVDINEFKSICQQMADDYRIHWDDIMSNSGIFDPIYFTFIPTTFEKRKGGFHVMILCDQSISIDLRLQMYEEVKRSFVDELSNKYLGYLDGITDVQLSYNSLFDIGPIKSQQLLLPFAQKSSVSRQYELVDYTTDYFSKFRPWFVIPIVHNGFDTVNSSESVPTSMTSNLTDTLDDGTKMDNSILQLISEIERTDYLSYKHLGKSGLLIANFMKSLIYLNDQHVFWSKMRDNEARLKLIITPLIQFIYSNYFIEHHGMIPDNTNDDFVRTIVQIMLPLLKHTTRFGNEHTERDSFKSCFNHVKSFYMKYSGVTDAFSSDNQLLWMAYAKMSEKERKKLAAEQRMVIDRIKRKISNMFNRWSEFVTKIIMNGMTNEIEPFVEVVNDKDPRKGIKFDDVMPGQVSVTVSTMMEESFYVKTIRMWSMMFFFVKYYDARTVHEATRAVISSFIRYYIWHQPSDSKDHSVYIYNIRQTKLLSALPYNQWVKDTVDNDNLKSWINTLYKKYIYSELQTVNMNSRMMVFIDNLNRAGISIKDNWEKNLKPFSNSSNDINKLYENVLNDFMQEHYQPPMELSPTSSPMFPMRQGILEFKDDGKLVFYADNHNQFMSGYTNVVWDGYRCDELGVDLPYNGHVYDVNCKAYQRVNKMIEQIYPEPDEREYALSVYSTVLYGGGTKDLFLILYGTGGDGKTTMSNAIQCMLGGDGISDGIKMIEDGKDIYVRNPCGLSASMKTETILMSNKNNHDEGGIIHLYNKRYCSVQEPDQNISDGKINVSRIKEILSGTAIIARGIFKSAKAFVPKALITLQTNVLMGYNEDTDAAKRRISVLYHRSKFSNNINKDRLNTLKYHFEADGTLNDEITNNPAYWQALFYILLPYAIRMKRSRCNALSDIPRPDSINMATLNSFNRSNGLVEWINSNINKRNGCVICMADLVKLIIAAHRIEKKNGGSILTSSKPHEQRVEIYQQLCGTYMGSIYRLQHKYLNNYRGKLKDESFRVVSDPNALNEELIQMHFEEHAVSNLEEGNGDKSDLYIIGYDLNMQDGPVIV